MTDPTDRLLTGKRNDPGRELERDRTVVISGGMSVMRGFNSNLTALTLEWFWLPMLSSVMLP